MFWFFRILLNVQTHGTYFWKYYLRILVLIHSPPLIEILMLYCSLKCMIQKQKKSITAVIIICLWHLKSVSLFLFCKLSLPIRWRKITFLRIVKKISNFSFRYLKFLLISLWIILLLITLFLINNKMKLNDIR